MFSETTNKFNTHLSTPSSHFLCIALRSLASNVVAPASRSEMAELGGFSGGHRLEREVRLAEQTEGVLRTLLPLAWLWAFSLYVRVGESEVSRSL